MGTAGTSYALSFGIRNNGAIEEVQWYTENPSTGRTLIGSPAVNDGLWHHAAVVIDVAAERLKFYHDGSLLDNVTISGLNLDVAGAVSGFVQGSPQILHEIQQHGFAFGQVRIQQAQNAGKGVEQEMGFYLGLE